MNVLCKLAPELLTPPNFNEIPQIILHNPHFFSYFEGAVGAMDGALIPAHVKYQHQNAYRSRKGSVFENVLAICDFDMMFTYVYAGWEGSACDAHVLYDAIRSDQRFTYLPEGKYFLVDAGYTNYAGFLAPYRQTRYHLKEFNSSGSEARSAPEMFNHRHARLRNVIERSFGVLKSRFPILKWGMPNYVTKRQTKLVIACCVLHNFIRKYSRDDDLFQPGSQRCQNDPDCFGSRNNPTQEEIQTQSHFIDQIANAMWEQRMIGERYLDLDQLFVVYM
ncbi:putative nuclease harbi1 [Phtheirospermum japonicum]|uniref:Putative nuclease harbi1 n=1 Tax=Phtheirospermum japonicum TaxID=374723 RepID=A0A830C287_9LAMI|nr:putative nuclease harbi1 [Phtheirospermum japonicum]